MIGLRPPPDDVGPQKRCKVWIARDPPRTPKSGNLSAAVFAECVGDDTPIESASGELAGRSAYSALNACIGSRRDARNAGTIHANAATASSVAATAAKTAGSS